MLISEKKKRTYVDIRKRYLGVQKSKFDVRLLDFDIPNIDCDFWKIYFVVWWPHSYVWKPCVDVARSFARSLDRPLGRSLATSPSRYLANSIGRSLDRSLARSLLRSFTRSLDRSLDRSLVRFISGVRISNYGYSVEFVGGSNSELLAVHHIYFARLRISNHFLKELRSNIFIVSGSIIHQGIKQNSSLDTQQGNHSVGGSAARQEHPCGPLPSLLPPLLPPSPKFSKVSQTCKNIDFVP